MKCKNCERLEKEMARWKVRAERCYDELKSRMDSEAGQ